MVLEEGLEPSRPYGQQIFLPATIFIAKFLCLWSGLSLHLQHYLLRTSRQVSTRSLSGFARDCHLTGFPEFDWIHNRISSKMLKLSVSLLCLPIPPLEQIIYQP